MRISDWSSDVCSSDLLAVRDQIVLHQRGEGRDGDAQPDRPRREIDRNRILGPRRIALHAAEAAKALELIESLIAHQIMAGVQHRPGIRHQPNLVFRSEGRRVGPAGAGKGSYEWPTYN